jgi:N-acetylmuramoyl-L-alanine amidase
VVAVRGRLILSVTAGSLLLAACGAGTAAAPASTTAPPPSPSARTSSPPPVPSTSATPPTTSKPPAKAVVVVLDPGHNGGNARDTAAINKLVPAGRGEMKPCNTTGTSTNAGYPEHAFTFDVAKRVGAELEAHGIKVVYTRDNDTGVGPCVDKRAETGNAADADAVVSIHGDGSNSAGAHGFHVAYSSPALNAEQREPSVDLATVLRDGMRSAGFSTANYIGHDGLFPRADLGGLNLSTRPAALIECGNMRNATEAAAMSSATGRQHYADAIAAAIEKYVTA